MFKVFRFSYTVCTLMFVQCPNACHLFPSTDSELSFYSPHRFCGWERLEYEYRQGQEIFLFSVTLFRSYGAHPASCMRKMRAFLGEWQKVYGIDYPTPSSAWLRMGTSVPQIPLITFIPYYSIMFNVDCNDDSYYQTRGSHAYF